MAGIKLQKRDYDFFVSYGHGDLDRVVPLVNLLKRECGMRIWFDGADGNASMRSSDLLGRAIGNARGALFCLSESWKGSSWCRGEYDVSLSEQREHDGFEIVNLRLDDVEPPTWFHIAEIVDMRENNASAIARLLRSLDSHAPHRADNKQDVYLAAPWGRPSPLAREAFETLSSTGWRLVGDAPNLKHLGEQRIAAIQRTTRAVVALMPFDASQAGIATSPHILEEARLALKVGKRLLLLIEPGVDPPQELVTDAFQSQAFALAHGAEGREALKAVLDDFDDELDHVSHDDTGSFIFFASSLRAHPAEADDIESVIVRSSNMPCVRGERLAAENVQTAIIDRIRRAAVLIADVSDDHRNTLIEVGVAMGCGTQVKLMCRKPIDGAPLKKRFMFEGQEYYWYSTPEERLGLCYYFARQFRRRVYVFR
jgi:hypothetical protein